MTSIRDDPYIKFLGSYITYKGKVVRGLIKGKMERGLENENIDKYLVCDECRLEFIRKTFCLPTVSFSPFMI
jgi:hypothetical protein